MITELQTDLLSTRLQQCLENLYPDAVFPDVYTGPLPEYIVWNYNQLPAVWAEGVPHAARYLIQVHFYLPHKKSPLAAILALQQAISAAGFTLPQVTDATDAEGQHWVLECEYADGGGLYGYA